ncbi:hypothetical protein F511_20375 [Dorcoceras hygrometricum]|uniref:Uncharacterized protein n=1 Tax=Dorcoceras hygrometricum TaxID=472368 RepID=A0A2Z7CTS9_9LAMI|nr:hypothetical protein F511_20375 [Dorcoceras hygrometricum]
MNKVARSSSRADKKRAARSRDQLDSTTEDAIKSTSWCKEPSWLKSNQLSKAEAEFKSKIGQSDKQSDLNTRL